MKAPIPHLILFYATLTQSLKVVTKRGSGKCIGSIYSVAGGLLLVEVKVQNIGCFVTWLLLAYNIFLGVQ